jgi:hypothetical protein
LRNGVDLDDLELGRQALAVLRGDGAGGKGRCSGCHAIARPTLSLWAYRTRAFSSACLGRTTLENQAQVDQTYRCMIEHATAGLSELGAVPPKKEPVPKKGFLAPAAVGIYAAAAHLPWFSFLIENASELQPDARAARDRFIQRVGMPRGQGARLTQEEFDLLAEWFGRDLPGMLELVPEEPGEPCVPGLSPELAADLDELAQVGWRAKNLETPLLMFGCAAGDVGSACLKRLPSASDSAFGTGWSGAVPGSTIRVLYDNTDNPATFFWSRSSADGRYVASGLAPDVEASKAAAGLSGQFVDLSGTRRMLADFAYDPTFFPDNSGLLVQGSQAGGSLLCNQSVLDGRFDTITTERDGCTSPAANIGLYQQLATALDGRDYWAVDGLFESDEPGFAPRLNNPFAPFAGDTALNFTPVINQGNAFEVGKPIVVPAPFQGDPALSPSGRLLVTRTRGAERLVLDEFGPFITATQSGYSVYRVNTTRDGKARSVALERAGQICMEGGKGTFSYDERWLVTYRYITAADAIELGFENAESAAFADYAKRGGANIYLIDLKSGQTTRITNMAPGQYALFPHFRSDGWIYFVVRSSDETELFAASDAALRLEDAGARP